jgi:hypothetical protein
MLCRRCIRDLIHENPFRRWNSYPHPFPRRHLDKRAQSTPSNPDLTSTSPVVSTEESRPTRSSAEQVKTVTLGIPKVIKLLQTGELKPISPPLVPLPIPALFSASTFFNYLDQRTTSNSMVDLWYTKSIGQTNYVVSQMKGNVLGFSIEWMKSSCEEVSLVGICDENIILLVHISLMSISSRIVTNDREISKGFKTAPRRSYSN